MFHFYALILIIVCIMLILHLLKKVYFCMEYGYSAVIYTLLIIPLVAVLILMSMRLL